MVARLLDAMRGLAVGHHDFAHHQHAVLALAVRIDRDRLEHAVGAAAFGLHGRAAVEAPQRKLLQRREAVEFLDLRLAAQVGDGRVPVEPDVFELVLCHCSPLRFDDATMTKSTRLAAKAQSSRPAATPVVLEASTMPIGAQAFGTAKKWACRRRRRARCGTVRAATTVCRWRFCPIARRFSVCSATHHAANTPHVADQTRNNRSARIVGICCFFGVRSRANRVQFPIGTTI